MRIHQCLAVKQSHIAVVDLVVNFSIVDFIIVRCRVMLQSNLNKLVR